MKKPKIPPQQKELRRILDTEDKKIVEYMTDKEINGFIKEINSRYLHWDEFVYRTPPKGASRELIWMLMKFNRDATAKKLNIGNEKNFSFKFNLLDKNQQKLHEFDMNLGGVLGSAQIIPSEEKNRYLISSIMEEAIASSQLEGASTTRKVAKEMLKTSRKPRNKSEKMILNNYLTAKIIKDSKLKRLTPEFILEIHKNIVRDTLEDSNYEGRFRNTDDIMVVDNVTGDIAYHPPSYETIPKLIEEVCNFVNNDGKYYIHPIVKASILHFLIGYIHPFVDGNGRTARALFYWYLSKEGYWVIEFMSISRVIIKSPIKYARSYLYTETDDNDLTYFINYQIRTMDIALRELRNYISRKINEKKDLFKIIENVGQINIRQVNILREFLEDEKTILTIKEVQELYNVVYQTARNDLLELEKAGFLRHQVSGKKKLIFLRSKDFDKLIESKINRKNS